MKKNRIQVILPDAIVDKFEKEAIKQSRSKSNLAGRFIIDGLKSIQKENETKNK